MVARDEAPHPCGGDGVNFCDQPATSSVTTDAGTFYLCDGCYRVFDTRTRHTTGKSLAEVAQALRNRVS